MKAPITIGAALAQAAAGLAKHQVRAFTAAAEFINAGGTLDEWTQVYRVVSGKLTEQHASDEPGTRKASGAKAQPAPKPSAAPSPAELESRAAARDRASRSVFNRYLTHTGRMWGNVTYDELDHLRDDGELAAKFKSHIGPLSGTARYKKLRDLLNAREFVQLINSVKIKPN
jgi:hypothetical protein